MAFVLATYKDNAQISCYNFVLVKLWFEIVRRPILEKGGEGGRSNESPAELRVIFTSSSLPSNHAPQVALGEDAKLKFWSLHELFRLHDFFVLFWIVNQTNDTILLYRQS